jgi:hypothetical protein
MLRFGAGGFVVALCGPVVLWHQVITDIASQFRLEWRYLLMGWSPWVLMALGLTCLATAGIVEWRNRDHRFYAAGGAAWAGWGVSLYILGFALATQVAQIHDGFSRI